MEREQKTMGKPLINFDLDQVSKLASIGCTLNEIAWFFNCHPRTVDLRIERDEEFKNAVEKGRELGRISLRRLQWQSAEGGNPAMLIWLGKQLLGQRERWDGHITGDVTHTHAEEAKQIISGRLDRISIAQQEGELDKVAH